MNPIASIATQPAPREGATTDQRMPIQSARQAVPGIVASSATSMVAPEPAGYASAAQRLADRTAAVTDKQTAASNTAEPGEDTRGTSLETGARPAPPLKSFAQIPTKVMEEISRLREEAAQTTAEGVPGRDDPTPVPASAAAIGPMS